MAGRGKKSNHSAAGSKVLLTTLAMLGTLGGWAYLAAEGAEDSEAVPTPQVIKLELPPVPTLVSPPDSGFEGPAEPTAKPPVLRQVNEPASSGGSGGGGGGGGGAAARTRSSG